MTKPIRGNKIRVGDRVNGRLVIDKKNKEDGIWLIHGPGRFTVVQYDGLVSVDRIVRVENLDEPIAVWTSESNGY
jgi:hypothetical protein